MSLPRKHDTNLSGKLSSQVVPPGVITRRRKAFVHNEEGFSTVLVPEEVTSSIISGTTQNRDSKSDIYDVNSGLQTNVTAGTYVKGKSCFAAEGTVSRSDTATLVTFVSHSCIE